MTFKPITYLSIGATYRRLRQNIKVRPQAEHILVLESYGRVLSKDVISDVNIPVYDSSHMDGFAVLANDIKHASDSGPITLKIVRNVGLGKFPSGVLHSGQAYRISTGGYLPQGANTVVPVEYTHISKDKVGILASFPKGSFVSPLGNDVRQESLLLHRGNVLRGQDVALLAMVSITRVPVFRKPRVAIIPTGDELTDNLNEIKGVTAKIMNTNSHIISRLVQEGGGVSFDLGVTPDNVNKVRKKIRLALEKTDMILTTAGSSVGEYDVVEQSINSLGRPGVLAHGVKLDRGRVAGVGVLNGKPVIILPGPIQGAVNAFIVFAQPLLRYLSGLPEFNGLRIEGILTEKWEARKKFNKFTKIAYVNAWLSKDGNVKATPITGETAMMTVLTKANGYLLLPEMTTAIEAGEKVYINVLPGLSYASGHSTNFLRRGYTN
ncbi:MAG: molybdopterin molybdotransferase MoeA [Candidatus Nitrosopolaris sp.]